MNGLLRDLRQTARSLRRSPGFAVATIATLAVGIGANAAIFSVARAALWRPLPFRDPGRLVWIWSQRVGRDRAFFSIPNFLDSRAAAPALSEMAALSPWAANLTGKAEAERVQGVRLTGNALATLAARAAAGRLLGPADAEPAASRTAVLTHGFWLRRFAADPGVVGRPLLLNGEAFTVAGVLAPGFFFPGYPDAEIAIPLSLGGDERRAERGSNFLRAFGRLAEGSTAAQAQGQLSAVSKELRRRYPDDNGTLLAPRLVPLARELAGGSRATLLLLLAAVGLLLAIACANIAAMALVRSLRRRGETAVKKALGARSARLVREAMTEMAALSAAGGIASIALAALVRPALEKLRPPMLPASAGGSLEAGVLLYTAAIALAAAAASAAAPALSALRVQPLSGLKEPAGAPGRRGRRLRSGFVVAQVALSLLLLSGAALLGQSLARLLAVSPGFDPRNVLAVQLSLPASAYPDGERARRFFERVEKAVREVPEVTSSGAASVLPLSGANNRTDFEILGRPAPTPEEMPGSQNRWVDGGYFETMRIPLRRGRLLKESDDGRSVAVAVVDETLARRYWPDGDPIGSRLRITATKGVSREVEIVGVAGSVRHMSLEEEPGGTLYEPIAQTPATNLAFLGSGVSLVVRTSGPPLLAARAIRKAIRSVDPDIPTGNVRTLDEAVAAVLSSRRFAAALVAFFAAAAAALAGAGLYGTLSQLVAEGRREIGIRVALGANAAAIRRHVLGRGAMLALAGIAAGLLLWMPASRLAAGLLYGVGPWNPAAMAIAAALLSAVAALATLLPARRAARVDPMTALRSE